MPTPAGLEGSGRQPSVMPASRAVARGSAAPGRPLLCPLSAVGGGSGLVGQAGTVEECPRSQRTRQGEGGRNRSGAYTAVVAKWQGLEGEGHDHPVFLLADRRRAESPDLTAGTPKPSYLSLDASSRVHGERIWVDFPDCRFTCWPPRGRRTTRGSCPMAAGSRHHEDQHQRGASETHEMQCAHTAIEHSLFDPSGPRRTPRLGAYRCRESGELKPWMLMILKSAV
jgi:ssDNA-binding Zn-finger/Zn-ribbon topoisomerase 1